MLKATILTKNLKTALSFSTHAISSRSQLPILLNLLLEFKDSQMTVSATDLEVGIIVSVPAKVDEEGSITVPAKTFSDLLANIDQEKIELEEVEKTLKLKGSGVSASFPTLPAEEFPKLYEEKGEKIGEFSREEFDREVSRIVFSSSLDSGRPALSGLLVKKEDGEKGLSIVATDGFRLSLSHNLSLEMKKGERESLIIPSRVIREVLAAKSEEKSNVEIFTSSKSNQVIFEYGEFTIIGRLIEAEYPDYQKIIPDDFSTQATFDRLQAQNAVRACSVFAREAANIIRISILKNSIKFSASASSVGEDEIEIEAKVEGEENEIAFNARYLLELFSTIESEQMDFQMTGPLNAGVFKTPGDKNFLHLIMPIRIQDGN